MPKRLSDVNFNHLFYFHQIASAGSLSKASEELGVAQSTLSQQLKQLEEQFESTLFIRDPGGLKLNDAGRRMYRYSKIIFRTGQRLIHAFDGSVVEDKLVIDVGVSSSVSRSFAADYFVPLFEDPDVMVRLKHGDYDYLLHDLVSHQIDLLLSDQKPSLPKNGGLSSQPVSKSSLVLVRATASDTLEQMVAENSVKTPFLNYSVSSRYRWEVDQYFMKEAYVFNTVGEVDDVLIMKAAVEQGICVAALPESVVREDIERHRLTAIDNLTPLRAAVYASYHRKDPSEYVISIIEKLQRGLKNGAEQ